ncbi:MAG: acetate/propionate family kinase [bacterium]
MPPPRAHILSINGGSSSIKFALFECSQPMNRILSGAIDRIGLPDAHFYVTAANPDESFSSSVAVPDHSAAATLLMNWSEEREKKQGAQLTAIGHRLVHGGPNFSTPQKITPEIIEELRKLEAFDPEHLTEEIFLAEIFKDHFPDIPQIACFDTAFHHNLPRVTLQLPIPRCYETHGVRRYGFHGLSYEYLMAQLACIFGDRVAQECIILAHLGNGASLAAVKMGKSVDTTMSLTPTSGVPMGCRSGDLDPGLQPYLQRAVQMTPENFNKMVNFESGLLGVSESSANMQDLLAVESTDFRAAEAIALFCYQIKKSIGAYAAALGGVHTLIFSGGIGENSPIIRSRICEGLEFMGIRIDQKANDDNQQVISSETERVRVMVLHTDEELMIANSVMQVIESTCK